ncbi:hypothetical protein F5B17DRAFT_436995 [Nemania serpens]|nr:hypothetical protein F5B17DRAFT_436995 [Nemania serpens]
MAQHVSHAACGLTEAQHSPSLPCVRASQTLLAATQPLIFSAALAVALHASSPPDRGPDAGPGLTGGRRGMVGVFRVGAKVLVSIPGFGR